MKLLITILKYHSWYLCQISLQIILLPIQILCFSPNLDKFIPLIKACALCPLYRYIKLCRLINTELVVARNCLVLDFFNTRSSKLNFQLGIRHFWNTHYSKSNVFVLSGVDHLVAKDLLNKCQFLSLNWPISQSKRKPCLQTSSNELNNF